MTPEQRWEHIEQTLAVINDRHASLAKTMEIVAGMQRENEKRFEENDRRISERHAALAQTVEILAGMQRENEKRFDENQKRISDRHTALAQTVEIVAGMQRENEKRFAVLTTRTIDCIDTINRLAHIAELHDQRLDDLEGMH